MTLRRRVAICGAWIEACSFSGQRSTRHDFTRLDDRALLERRYPFLLDGELARRADVDWLPLVHSRALPGGPVGAATYDELQEEILGLLRAHSPIDGVVLDVHGAMLVEGRTDVEAGLASRVREAVGDRALIAVVEDLHGNTTAGLVGKIDLVTAFRTAPHEDETETRLRGCEQLLSCLEHDVSPWRAWVRVPMLVTGERSSTRSDPAKRLYELASTFGGHDGVIDASIWMGYPWQDEARSAVTVVATGTDPISVRDAARALAAASWEERDGFVFDSPAGSARECIEQALRSGTRPFLVSDTGDNPTAGGRGDSSYFLARLLEQPDLVAGRHTAICASIADASAVAACVEAGNGSRVALTLRPPSPSEPPIELRGEVAAVLLGDALGGDEAVVAVGGISCVLTSRRKPFHLVSDFTDLALDPAAVDLTVVKIGYLEPELHAIAAAHMLALTPGAVDQELSRLDYRHVIRPIHPLDTFSSEPSFEPVVFGPRRSANATMTTGHP
jgi:microcystin degradation protein MlrC